MNVTLHGADAILVACADHGSTDQRYTAPCARQCTLPLRVSDRPSPDRPFICELPSSVFTKLHHMDDMMAGNACMKVPLQAPQAD